MLYFAFKSVDRKAVKSLNSIEVLLSNGERFEFESPAITNVPYFTFYLDPFDNLNMKIKYTSTYREWSTIAYDSFSGDVFYAGNNSESESSKYLFNQLAIYDIKQMIINQKITLSPLFRSSELFKPLIVELRSSLADKSFLPDINNLDHSWARKEINVKVESDLNYGDRVTWDDYIATNTDPKIDFRFSLLPANGGNRAIIDFFCLGYSMPERLSYADKDCLMTIKLSNGVEFATKKAICQPTLTARRVNFCAGLDKFADTRNPSVIVTPKTMLQQLAKYDVVEVKFMNHTIDLRNADGSTAELFGKMCKVLLEKTGATDLYALNTPAPAVRPTTTPKTPATKPAQSATTAKPTSTTTKSDAEAIAEADRRAVELMKQAQNKSAKKPTATSNEEPKGVLLPAFNKLKYGRYIARYDHIAPSQLMYTPLALFTSRAIPMDALLEMMDGAKGIGAAKVSETTTGKFVTVQPTEFYCRLRGYEDMPCATMSVGYDANDAQQIKTATFIYNLPASWKRSKVKEYAKAFSEDMHRLGMRWSEEKDQYVGSHEGHFITIAYGSKSEDNHIYVYIRYAEEK